MYTHEPAGPGSERGCVGDTPTSSHSVPTAITVPGHLSHAAGLGSLLLPFLSPQRPALYPAVAGRRGGRAGGGPTSISCLPSPQPASQASRLLKSPGRPVPLPNSTIYRPQRRGALGGPRPAGPSQRRSMRTPWGWGRSIPGRGRTGCAGQK